MMWFLYTYLQIAPLLALQLSIAASSRWLSFRPSSSIIARPILLALLPLKVERLWKLLYDEPLCCPTHYTDIKLLKKNDEPLWCPIHYYCLLLLPLTAAVLNYILECPECPEDDWYLPRFCQLLENHEMRTKRRWTKKKSMKKGNKYLRPRLELSIFSSVMLSQRFYFSGQVAYVSVHQIMAASDPIASLARWEPIEWRRGI